MYYLFWFHSRGLTFSLTVKDLRRKSFYNWKKSESIFPLIFSGLLDNYYSILISFFFSHASSVVPVIEVSVGQLVGKKCQSISSHLFKRLPHNSAQTFFKCTKLHGNHCCCGAVTFDVVPSNIRTNIFMWSNTRFMTKGVPLILSHQPQLHFVLRLSPDKV